MKLHKSDPMGIRYYLAEFSFKEDEKDMAIQTALARYLASINLGAYAGLSFWAAGLVGAQKRAINKYIGEKK